MFPPPIILYGVMLMKERWIAIEGYKGLYEVSNLGRVKSLISNGLILKQSKDKDGYYIVSLKRKSFRVHRLVAIAFIPNPNNLAQVNHKDEDKTNNCVDNLEWCDATYNINYGTRNEQVRKSLKGQPHTKERIENIRKAQKEYWSTHENPRSKRVFCGGREFNSIKECANFYNVKAVTMRTWLNGKRAMPKEFKELNLHIV